MNYQGKKGAENETLSKKLSFLFDNMKYLKYLSLIFLKG